MKILFAEDDEFIAKLVLFKLSKEGHEVTHVADGAQAEKKFHEPDWNLFIFDVMMPHQDGWSLLKKIKAIDTQKNKPVIMLTAKAHPDDFERAMSLKADYYLRKPFNPEELANLIREIGSK